MLLNIDNKAVLLLGATLKIQEDLKYIFPELQDAECISGNCDIQQWDNTKYFMIICTEKEDQYVAALENNGWKRHTNFISLKDISKKFSNGVNLLNIQEEREIIFWGTGAISSCYNDIQGVEPVYYIDSDENKHGKVFNEKKIVSFDESMEICKHPFFVVMTDNYYYEIEDFLNNKGLVRGEDYIYYKKLLPNMVGDMFLKTIFDTPKDYQLCQYPFNRVVIYENGDVMCCCEGMQTAYGNLMFESGEEVWNSLTAKIIRLSIINKTYSFCRKDMCPYLMKEFNVSESRNENLVVSKTPEWIGMGIDYTCNLYCQSCRKERRIAKGESLKRIQSVAQKIEETEWLDKAERSSIAGMGEALFSPTYRHLIFDNVKNKRKSITIGTNGMLISREVVNKLNQLYEEISFSVSIDAASENVYKNIRRGGDFNKVKENISLLYEMKKEGLVKSINMVFVVQKENYKEMKAFAEWGISIEAILIFYALHNWGTYSDEEYAERSMIDLKTRKLKPELEEIMRDPIWRRKGIIMDEIKNCSKSYI